MALMMKWQSGTDYGTAEVCAPVTEREKVVFAEYILDAVRHGWAITYYVEHSNNEGDE